MGKEKQDSNEEVLAVIYRAIELKENIELRRVFKILDTQNLTVCALLTNDSTLAQVSAGKGKSSIIGGTSINKALYGKEVIKSSSSVLAKRDDTVIIDIYNLFGINVSHNCSEDSEIRNQAYSGNQVVVYGPLSNFERDYLLNKIYEKNILGYRFFNIVMSEIRLIQGWKMVGKEVARRITINTLEEVVCDSDNAGVDTVVENYLQSLCEGIASVILSDIERKIQEHNISINLEKVYKVLGSEKAKKIIDGLNKRVFTRQSYVEELLSTAEKIASSVTQGMAEAVKKRRNTSNKLELLIYVVSKIVVMSQRFVQIANMRQILNNILCNLDQEINRLYELEKDLEHNQNQEVEKDYESFKGGVIDKWKSLLSEKAWQIIAWHIVSPVLEQDAYHLVRCVAKKMQEAYQSYKERGNFERFKELKLEHEEKIQSKKQCDDNTTITENQITERYHKKLQKLMIKTRSPDLLAEIVRDNIPMDMVCVRACTQVVPNILKEQGVEISGLTIIVEGNNGLTLKFSSVSEGSDIENYIPLQLRDNHFEFRESITTESNGSSDLKNNCLYEALSKAIPELNNIISPEGFRVKVADCIKLDKGIRFHIQQGWHSLPISRGVFGGRPYKFASSRSKLTKEAEYQSPYQHSSSRGGWEFDEFIDVDLREHKNLTNKESHEQRVRAFNAALKKINERLLLIDRTHKKIDSSIFTPTKFDTILCSTGYGKIGIGLYPVEMEATVDVRVPGEQFKYKLRIDVDNPIIEMSEQNLQGPHGPHVGYDVIRPSKRAPEGITGHILINRMENKDLPDRGRSQYTFDSNSRSMIPLSRVFSLPIKPNTYLERVGTTNISQIDRRKIRGRSYPSKNF